MMDIYQRRQAFIGLGSTEQAREARRFVADYVLRDRECDGELVDYCREHRVLRQTVALLIHEFRKALSWGEVRALKSVNAFSPPVPVRPKRFCT